MTEDERTALVQQINRGANLSNHQMDAVMGALTHLGWQPPKQKSELAQIDTPARCEPPTLSEQRLMTKINNVIEGPLTAIRQKTKRMSWQNRRIVWASVMLTAQKTLDEMEGKP